eukprot:gnl/Dysnectes_brevis/3540_a4498_1414.p1 GENE.gnl/Dysnectes_brevis/3540_a4498_1414~~gnl/Dysnectes_brevis/3540_a4498_1414.p1  ORF type:complete len:147 (-),score=27.83 gnl/Dysnectes_brevis/3540_a4498_1414:56-496(-)
MNHSTTNAKPKVLTGFDSFFPERDVDEPNFELNEEEAQYVGTAQTILIGMMKNNPFFRYSEPLSTAAVAPYILSSAKLMPKELRTNQVLMTDARQYSREEASDESGQGMEEDVPEVSDEGDYCRIYAQVEDGEDSGESEGRDEAWF